MRQGLVSIDALQNDVLISPAFGTAECSAEAEVGVALM